MFEVTWRQMAPTDVVRLLDMVIVNVLVGNTDAHAKNYSIMIRGNGTSLAPLYDVMCGEVWEDVTKNLAQKIAGKSWGEYLNGLDWQLFARECGLNPKQVIDRVGTLAKSVISEAGAAQFEVAAMPAGGHAILEQARQAVERRARTMLAQLQELGDDPITKAAGGAEEAEAAAALVSTAAGVEMGPQSPCRTAPLAACAPKSPTPRPTSKSIFFAFRAPGRAFGKCTHDVSDQVFGTFRAEFGI